MRKYHLLCVYMTKSYTWFANSINRMWDVMNIDVHFSDGRVIYAEP